MKFEQLLHIYWSRSFLYGGKTQSFNITLGEFFITKPGLGGKVFNKARVLFTKRFEPNNALKSGKRLLSALPLDQRRTINVYLSKITSINNAVFELVRFNQIRLYLIKTFRGRCHALGKPSRGQRTWSNASTAYHCNHTVRAFIRQVKKNNAIVEKPVSKNRKLAKKKVKRTAPKIRMIFTKQKENPWF